MSVRVTCFKALISFAMPRISVQMQEVRVRVRVRVRVWFMLSLTRAL